MSDDKLEINEAGFGAGIHYLESLEITDYKNIYQPPDEFALHLTGIILYRV